MTYAILTITPPKISDTCSGLETKEHLPETHQLEDLLKSSGTILEENDGTLPRIYMGDCPCPCPPIATAGLYVVFSPIS